MAGEQDGGARAARVIVVFWDGMRPDYVTEELTPNLCALAAAGSRYRRATGIFPSVTRPTTSSVSTGTTPATHGVVGNLFVGPPGDRAPLDTGDRAALERLRAINGGRILPVTTLAEAVAAAGKRVVVMGSGSTGQAALLDPEHVGTTIHTGFTVPEALFAELSDRFGPPPAKAIPVNAANDWLNTVLTDYVLPDLAPDLAIIWQCEPDATQHARGLGAPDTLDAIRGNDARLGRLLAAVEASGVPTAIIVGSDHGHSTVTGMVRTREVLADAGFGAALDTGQLYFADQAFVVEDGPGAGAIRDRLGAWLAAQPWVGGLVAWDEGGARPDGALTPGELYGERDRPGFAQRPTFTYSHSWTAEPNAHGAPGSAYAGFVESLADFARLQGPIVGLNRLTSTHGTLAPHDQNTVLVLAGAGIRPGAPDLPAAVTDIAPTVLALLGLPPLPTAEGRALAESFADGPEAGSVAVEAGDEIALPSGTLRRYRVGGATYLDTGLPR